MTKYIELSADQRFLIVDEGQTVRDSLSMALKNMGLKKIFSASDAGMAMRCLTEERVDFMICDRNLRGVTGMELLREIRESPEIERIPFVMMAGEISKEDVILASEFGIDGYLGKPFVLKEVSAKLTQAMQKYTDPNNPERYFEEARLSFLKGDCDRAIQIYKSLQKNLPQSVRTRVGIAKCLRSQEKLDEALEVLREAIAINDLYVHAHHEMGLIFLQQDESVAALHAFDAAIKASPLNPIRYEAIADILMKDKRYASAEEYLTKAVKLELAYPELYSQLGRSLFAQKKTEKAKKYFEQALRDQPSNTSFLNSLGICHKDLGEYEAALKQYNTALKYRQSDVKILFNKALCLISMGDTPRAIKTLKTIIGIDPSYTKATAKLATLEKPEKAS